MSDQQLIGLLEKYLEGSCSNEEKLALESWYETYKSRRIQEKEQPDLLSLYNDITGKLKADGEWKETTVRKMNSKWWKLSAAAALLIIIAAGSLILFSNNSSKQLIVNTEAGERKKITLADGTLVWMNVGSLLRYPNNMAASNRTVVLEGEAFFDVAKDEAKPFSIQTTGMYIRVLGTQFNIKAYKDDETVEASLIQGSIAIEHQNNKLILKAGEKLTLMKNEPDIPGARIINWGDRFAVIESLNPQPQNAANELQWMNNTLSFKDKSFPEMARLMSRWYKRTIILKDSFPADYKFKGTFKQESVTDVLNALQITADFKYTIKGDTIYLHH